MYLSRNQEIKIRIKQHEKAIDIVRKSPEYEELINLGFRDETNKEDEEALIVDIITGKITFCHNEIIIPSGGELGRNTYSYTELWYEILIDMQNNEPEMEIRSNFSRRRSTRGDGFLLKRYKKLNFKLHSKTKQHVKLRAKQYIEACKIILHKFKIPEKEYFILYKEEECNLHKYLKYKWVFNKSEWNFFRKYEIWITTKMDPTKLPLYINYNWYHPRYKIQFLERLKKCIKL